MKDVEIFDVYKERLKEESMALSKEVEEVLVSFKVLKVNGGYNLKASLRIEDSVKQVDVSLSKVDKSRKDKLGMKKKYEALVKSEEEVQRQRVL